MAKIIVHNRDSFQKEKPIRLYGKKKTEFKRDLWENRAKKKCETCGRCIPFSIDGKW